MFESLLQPARPVVHVTSEAPDELDDVRAALAHRFPASVIRVLRGGKVRSAGALFDHLATAFGFPSYFGANWNAVVDCLRDLPAVPHLLFVTAASELLGDAPPHELTTFAQILASLTGAPRGPSSFHLVLQAAPAELNQLVARLGAAGVDYQPA
jgi:hypothetical protein